MSNEINPTTAPNWDNVTQVTPKIQTSTPNWDNVQEVKPRPYQSESSPIGRAIRWVMKSNPITGPIEKWNTYQHVMEKYKNGIPSMEQVKKDAAEYEDKQAARDPWQQVAVPLTVGAGLWAAEQFATKTPVGAVATIAATAAGGVVADKLLPFKEWFNKVDPNPSPWVRDTVSIIDGLKNMAGMGAGAKLGEVGSSKLGAILNVAGVKPNVDLTPEHIEDIQTHPALTNKESADALKTMGIEDKHIQAAASTNSAISIPADRMMDLAKKPYYSKIRDVFNKPEEPKASDVKQNLNILQKGVEQGKQWGIAVGKGLNYGKRLFYNTFNSYMLVREKFGGAGVNRIPAALTRGRDFAAIDLAWDVIVRFPGMPSEYYDDWVQVWYS